MKNDQYLQAQSSTPKLSCSTDLSWAQMEKAAFLGPEWQTRFHVISVSHVKRFCVWTNSTLVVWQQWGLEPDQAPITPGPSWSTCDCVSACVCVAVVNTQWCSHWRNLRDPESLRNEIIQIKARGNYWAGYSPVQVQASSSLIKRQTQSDCGGTT